IKEALWRPGYDGGAWAEASLLTKRSGAGHVAWFIRKVEIPPGLQRENVVLSLGFLNRQSHLYWNGRELGYFQYPAPVETVIPGEWLRNGENVLTIRLANPFGEATAIGEKEYFYL